MKKSVIALTALFCALALTACSGEGDTVTTGSSATTEPTGSSATTTKATTTSEVSTDEPIATPSTPEAPADPGTPNHREEGKEYHLSTLIVPTNSQNLDSDYLVENTAQSNGDYRYADNAGYMIYRVDLTDKIDPTIDLLVLQNYYISVANNEDLLGEIKVVSYADEYGGTLTTGGNDVTITIDPYEYGCYSQIYIIISDTNPSDGWGGTIRSLSIHEYVEGAGEDVEVTLGEEG